MAQKLSVLEALAGRMGSSPVTLNFLRVVMSHYRMPLLGEILLAFRNVSYARLGIVQVRSLPLRIFPTRSGNFSGAI